MAILSKEINSVEVRIRKHPEKTYFQEFIKIGDREKLDATACDRYIIPEPGTTYEIEVTLKRGYQFAHSTRVTVEVFVAGANEPIICHYIHPPQDYSQYLDTDLTAILSYTGVIEKDGRKISGARPIFRPVVLVSNEAMKDKTDVMEVAPRDLGVLFVRVFKEQFEYVPMNPRQLENYLPQKNEQLISLSSQKNPWDVQMVDETSSKKHGITGTFDFIGGHAPERYESMYWAKNLVNGQILEFRFHCRPAEFLEHVNIVPYPPPLHSFSWEQLDNEERKVALKKLQDLARRRAHNYENFIQDFTTEPVDWSPWNILEPFERKRAFKNLQECEKRFQRGEIQTQISELPARRIIDLENQQPNPPIPSQKPHSSPVIILDSSGSRRQSGLQQPQQQQQQQQHRHKFQVLGGREIKKEDGDLSHVIRTRFPRQGRLQQQQTRQLFQPHQGRDIKEEDDDLRYVVRHHSVATRTMTNKHEKDRNSNGKRARSPETVHDRRVKVKQEPIDVDALE